MSDQKTATIFENLTIICAIAAFTLCFFFTSNCAEKEIMRDSGYEQEVDASGKVVWKIARPEN